MNINYPILQKGDSIGICAPAGIVSREEIDLAEKLIRSLGFKVKYGDYLFDNYRFFASSDNNRLADLQSLIDDYEVKAIIAARGGYGTGKIVDALDLKPLISNPKWIIGFSDLTVLHYSLASLGLKSIHGPVARQFSDKKMSNEVNSLFKILMGEKFFIQWGSGQDLTNEINGQIIGGNLSLITNCIGTRSDLDYSEKILFLEDVGENIYRVDRMLNQLERAQKLDHLKAVLIGTFNNIGDTTPSYKIDVMDLIQEYFQNYDYPVLFDFPVGHTSLNYPVIHNAKVVLRATGNKYRLSF